MPTTPPTSARASTRTASTLVLFNLPPGHWDKGERGFAALPGREDEFASAVDLALRYAEALGCPRLHAMAGLATHGAERASLRRQPDARGRNGRRGGVDILIEPINTRDIPGYFLNQHERGARHHRGGWRAEPRAAARPLSPPCHGGRCRGRDRRVRPARAPLPVRRPARSRRAGPGRDRLLAQVFRLIDATGYEGWIGCEYKPRGATAAGLVWAERCGVALG